MDKMDSSTTDTSNMVFNPLTLRVIDEYIDRPSHALILTGPAGSGKASTARYIVSNILGIPSDKPDKYSTHPYLRTIRPVDNKAIPIESIRELQGFLSLSIPGAVAGSIARVAVIEDSQLLTTEAQKRAAQDTRRATSRYNSGFDGV